MARKKLPVSASEWAEYEKKAKAANRRLDVMSGGQRHAVDYYMKGERFSRAIPATKQEFERNLEKVNRFLKSKQTTKRGWEQIKKTAVKNANKTLTKRRKYELTDEELANIFEEIETRDKKVMYTILDLVQAKKDKKEIEGSEFTGEELQQAIDEAFEEHLEAGEAIKKRNAARKRAGIQSKKAKELRKPKKRARRRPQR